MPNQCQLCGQSLPETITPDKLQARLQKLTSPALAAEKKKLKDEFEAKLADDREMARQRAERQFARELRAAKERANRAETEREQEVSRLEKDYSNRVAKETAAAKREAQNEVRKQLLDAQKRAKDADKLRRREVAQAQKESEARLQEEVKRAVRLATRKDGDTVDKIQAERQKDKRRHGEEIARLQKKLDEMSRKLDKKTGEELGEEAEVDLFTELRNAFCPNDKIDRIGRGIRGADIVHDIVDAGKIVGRIVYESKNTLDWNHGFITQAKKYQTQYETPHVMIVTRAFPPKQKGFCVEKEIPIIDSCAAIALAKIIRNGIIEVARLGLSGKFRDQKSQELFDYIVGDKFRTRFCEIASGVSSLRERQKKERTWHENEWELETKIHSQIESRHREVEAQIGAIFSRGSNTTSRKLTVRSEKWLNVLADSGHNGPGLLRE